jgi:tetratricopeptide (TPR) repeat protein
MTLRHKIVYVSLVIMITFALPAFPQATTDEYKKTIESADSYFSKGDYINAKASYQIAIRLAPEEQYPKDRLQQSLDMIKVQMYQNNLYTQKIQVANELYDKNDFPGALQYYQEALSILPGDVYASGRIQEINRTQVDAQQFEAEYQESIAAGDQYFKEGKLDKALAEYKNASALKPSESYPKQKANETEALIAQQKNITDEYQVALQNADLAISRNNYPDAISELEKAINLFPNEPLPKQKLAEAQSLKAAWDSYNSIITAADDYYVNKDFLLAKEKYLQAQSIKPGDDYPKRMLEKIDIALMDVEQANRSSYEFTIQKADELFSQQDYERAMVEYQNALRFKPDESYAQQRINDINNALNLRKSQEEAYTQAISRADLLFKEEKYTDAKAEFNRAIGIKPLEQYPKVKIEEINTILTDLSTKRELYTNLIKGADRLFFSDEYEESREQYRQASYLFPKEKYPLDQITMINEILGQRDTYIKAVTRADQLFFEQDYEASLMEFRAASALQPDEDYPKEKIREIERLMAAAIEPEEQAQALQNNDKQQVFEFEVESVSNIQMTALDVQYQDMIKIADEAMAANEYEEALNTYQDALKLKPSEIYAKEKIEKINTLLADLESKEIAAKAMIDKQFQDSVTTADLAFQNREYQKALTTYQAALKIKPGEIYPQQKIAEINTTLGDIAAKEALEKQYTDAVATADASLKAQDYQEALAGYQAAASLKPQAAYPKEKIAEINTTLGDIAAKEALEKQYTQMRLLRLTLR